MLRVYLFSQNGIQKGKGLDLGEELPSSPRPPGLISSQIMAITRIISIENMPQCTTLLNLKK